MSVDPSAAPRDGGCLETWHVRDLPEPRPFSFVNSLRTIGPGAILLAGAIGGGEWIVGPLMTVNYGREILWVATIAIILQVIFNLEGVRYTLYTGEPILTGIMRLHPGSKCWGLFYILLSVAQLGVPALAASCAAVVFASLYGRIPGSEGDAWTLLLITCSIVLGSTLLLMCGRTVEKVLERLSWFMVLMIFLFLIVVNVLLVSPGEWVRTLQGFVSFGAIPEQLDLLLLSLFAATAGAGGVGNLVISNWFRDKGFGMGAHVGSIGGLLRGSRKTLAHVGYVFPLDSENMRRWKTWWNYALIDQVLLWGLGCFVGMFLNVNLAAAIIPRGTKLEGMAAGTYQAQYLTENISGVFWVLALLNGFWILFSTHLSNTDGMVRTVCDVSWVAFPKLRRWPASRVYASLLVSFTVWGLVAVNWGSALDLFKILGIVASPIMAVASFQILRVNRRFLPPEIGPPLWRQILLVACGLVYAGFSLATLYSMFK